MEFCIEIDIKMKVKFNPKPKATNHSMMETYKGKGNIQMKT